jgi:type III pantothenate kinase
VNTVVIDIGNSGTKTALVSEGMVLAREAQSRRHYRSGGLPDWKKLFGFFESMDAINSIGFAAVVPDIRSSLLEYLERWSGDLVEVSASSVLPFRIDYKTPLTLGADRLAAATGAWNRFGAGERHVVVVDAGTAINYEIITADAVYHGGPIAPGLSAMHDALISDAAQLPSIPMSVPDGNIGNSTVTAIQAGVVYAFVDSVLGMLDRIRSHLSTDHGHLSTDVFVVVTGGDAPLLIDAGIRANRFEPDLVRYGIADILAATLSANEDKSN